MLDCSIVPHADAAKTHMPADLFMAYFVSEERNMVDATALRPDVICSDGRVNCRRGAASEGPKQPPKEAEHVWAGAQAVIWQRGFTIPAARFTR